MQADFLVYQAKSFYNAYIALEQIRNNYEKELLYFVPWIVNGAFSAELTLKAILAKNGIEYGKEHNLYVLFCMVPDSFQSELVSYFSKKAPEYLDAKKFTDELILISNVFVDWRYCFEGNPTPAFDARFLSAFANAAICTLFAHYNVDFVPSATRGETDDEINEMIRDNREQCIDRNISYIQKKLKE